MTLALEERTQEQGVPSPSRAGCWGQARVRYVLTWGPGRLLHEAVKRYLPRKATDQYGASPTDRRALQPLKESEIQRTLWYHTRCRICPAGFWSALVQYFLTVFLFLPFRMEIVILCHCLLEVCDLHFEFVLQGITDCHESQKRF